MDFSRNAKDCAIGKWILDNKVLSGLLTWGVSI